MPRAASDDNGLEPAELARLRRAAAHLERADFERFEPPEGLWGRIAGSIGSATGTTVVEYSIDANDVVVAVGGDWSQFASENQAAELARTWVGRELWTCLGDDDLRDLWRLLVSRVRRDGTALRVPFRCDAPRARRWFEMNVAPGAGAQVAFRSILVREEPRPTIALLDRDVERDEDAAPVAVCSWCGRGSVDGAWQPLDELVAHTGLLERSPLPPVSYGICPSCRERMSAELLVEGRSDRGRD